MKANKFGSDTDGVWCPTQHPTIPENIVMEQTKSATPSRPMKKRMSKAGFIKSQPRTMSGTEVVRKAKEMGLTFTRQYVYRIRSTSEKPVKGARKLDRAVAKTGSALKPTINKLAASPGAKSGAGLSGASFVRSLPSTMPIKEVIAKGTLSGLKLSRDYVSKIRREAMKKAGVRPKLGAVAGKLGSVPVAGRARQTVLSTGTAPAGRSAGVRRGRRRRSSAKADFIRSMPPTMSAKHVVAEAAKKGVKITPGYVYIIRGKSNAPLTGSPTLASRARAGVTPGLMTPEMVFVRLALDIGLPRAQALLSAVDAKLGEFVAKL